MSLQDGLYWLFRCTVLRVVFGLLMNHGMSFEHGDDVGSKDCHTILAESCPCCPHGLYLRQHLWRQLTVDSVAMLLSAEVARCDEEISSSVRSQVRSAIAGLDRKDRNVCSFQMLITPARRELLVLLMWS